MAQDGKPAESAKSSNQREPAEDNLYRRWSRRKGEERVDLQLSAIPVSSESEPTVAHRHDQPELTDADMPPLETLDEESDYSGFLSPGVSDSLRKAALKKLFRGERFNVIDGLDDYAEDYTRFEPLGDLVTADMRHQLQRELERLEKSSDTGEGLARADAIEEPADPPEESPRSNGETARPREKSADSSRARS